MIKETLFHRVIKVITLLLAILCAYKVVTAQERNSEYDRHLIWTAISGEQAYWRVETLPVRVCQTGDFGAEWNASIQQAITEMNVAVPTVFAADDCDIFITVLETIPADDCIRPDGTHAPACAEAGERYVYPVDIYLRHDFYQIAPLIHELMHAYGVWFHPERADSAVSVQFNHFTSNLTQFDIDLLAYLYSRPAYTAEQFDEQRAVRDELDQDYCAWVEAYLLTHELLHKYRCESHAQ